MYRSERVQARSNRHGFCRGSREVFIKLDTGWKGIQPVAEDLMRAGDTVLEPGQNSGVNKNADTSVTAPLVHVCVFGNGKVVSFHHDSDTATVKQVLSSSWPGRRNGEVK